MKRTSLIKHIQVWGILFLIGIGASAVTVDIITSRRHFNSRAKQMRSAHIARQKELIKHEVQRVVNLIAAQRAQEEIFTRKKIKSRLYEAFAIAQHIYQINKTTKSDAEIKKRIVDALRPIRFQQGNGYYFITRLDGTEVLLAARPEMEGVKFLNIQDKRGKYVIRDMIAIARHPGEGFYTHYWPKPNAEGKDFKKISYIKRFKPYDWFIGTGLYVMDVEAQIKANLLATISRIRFGKEGYIFVNRFNGDALVSNGNLISGEKKLWELSTDNIEEIRTLFKKERLATMKPGGEYINYSWKKLTDSNIESPKTSFVIGIPDLKWIIGAGVYCDDVETEIAAMQTDLRQNIKRELIFFSLIVAGFVALSFLLFTRLNHRLKADLDHFFSFFAKAVNSDKKINRESIRFIELDEIAAHVNRMMERRKKTETALRKSEEKYRNLFENMYDIFYQTDQKGKITLISPSVEKHLGYTSDELINKNMKGLFADWQARDRFVDLIKKDRYVEHFEARLRHKDTSTRWMSTNAKAIKDTAGNLIGVEGISRDISKRKRIESEKDTMETQLRQAHKMEAIGTLAGGIAHDFNNVLFSIMGYTELAMDDLPEGSETQKNLSEVMNGAMRASEMVQQILAFSRNGVTEKKPIKIQTVITEVLKLLRTSIPSTIEIQQNIDETCCSYQADPAQCLQDPGGCCRPVLADSTRIHQVIMNLATNAYQAMTDTGGVLSITVMEVTVTPGMPDLKLPPGDYLKITISDTGPGIDPLIIGKIFDPYFTTKEPGKGTGMGLSVVHGIVKDHGGNIGVTSQVGKGTTFEIHLPLIDAHPDTSPPAQPLPTPGGTEHILLIDDEATIVTMTRQMLERCGYRVTARTSSIEALEAFKANPDRYDLIITDMTMPNMTGAELAPRLRALRPDIPIIICTGFSEQIDQEKAESMGTTGYIMKPILKDELYKIVREALDGKKAAH